MAQVLEQEEATMQATTTTTTQGEEVQATPAPTLLTVCLVRKAAYHYAPALDAPAICGWQVPEGGWNLLRKSSDAKGVCSGCARKMAQRTGGNGAGGTMPANTSRNGTTPSARQDASPNGSGVVRRGRIPYEYGDEVVAGEELPESVANDLALTGPRHCITCGKQTGWAVSGEWRPISRVGKPDARDRYHCAKCK